jgi:hypothetical protein
MARRIGTILTAAATLVMIGTAAPAQAAPVTHTTESEEFTGTIEKWRECDGFDINLEFDVTLRITQYYDANGDLVRERVKAYGTGTLINSETGETNTGSSPQIYFNDFIEGTETTVGRRNHNNLPGEGNVALDAGRIVIDMQTGEVLFSAGPHPGEENIDWCSVVD